MYARISRVKAPTERIDDLVSEFTGKALPALKEIDGYAGHSFGVNRESGDCQAVTFWEGEDALEASGEAATRIRTATTQAAGASIASVETYETLMMERAQRPRTPAYVRVTRGQAEPGRIDELARRMRENALPAVRDLPGFMALVLNANRESGKFAITSVWSGAEEREASLEAIKDIRRETFEAIGAGDAEPSNYEVVSVEFVGAAAATS